jgi:uncharacterized protein (TIGR00725 family)
MTWYVAVVGPGTTATDDDRDTAREVGRRLAEAGCIVVNGGLDGVMAAAAAGVAEAGGTSVGLLPGADRSGAAADLTIAIPTGLGELRNALIVRSADAVIAVGGSWGTLSEVALSMRTGKPVVSVGGWRVTDDDGTEQPIEAALTAADAVAAVLRDRPPER